MGPCFLFPLVLFVLLYYPVLDEEVRKRVPLLCAYDIAQQLEAEIVHASSICPELPPNFGRILDEYGILATSESFLSLGSVSARKSFLPSEITLIRFIAWKWAVPPELVTSDPVGQVLDRLEHLAKREAQSAQRRDELLKAHALHCLKFDPSPQTRPPSPRVGLPPELLQRGMTFCDESIPLERDDVRRRVEYQINYLLTDFRATTEVWLKRKDRYGGIVKTILLQEGVPAEFNMLPALESGYSSSIVSPSMAAGWWQFLKTTAAGEPSSDKDYDWGLTVDQGIDERKDLVLSTRSAARYLKWIRSRLSINGKPCGWLMSAAAYNAGLAETAYRIGAYNTVNYWDVKLPRETEDYIPRWLALWIIDKHRSFYDMNLPRVPSVEIESLEGIRLVRDVPASLLAAIAGSSLRLIREINGTLTKGTPAFKARKGGGVDRPHTIHVPRGTGQAIMKALRAQGYVKDGS